MADLDPLEEVLKKHFVMWDDINGLLSAGEWQCACGKKFPYSDPAITHVAGALRAAGFGLVEGGRHIDG